MEGGRLTRSKAKELIASSKPGISPPSASELIASSKPGTSPPSASLTEVSSVDVDVQPTKGQKPRKRPQEQQDSDDVQQDVHKDKKAKSLAAAPSKSINVLSVGDIIPDIELLDDEGKSVSLHGIVKDAGAVFFIYPRANTPGCTKQACGFRDNYEKFVKDGFVPYGLSSDKPTAQANWKKKHNLPFNLLCDPKLEAIKAFGALRSASSAKRSHIVVEKGGKVRDIRIQISPLDSVSESLKTVQS